MTAFFCSSVEAEIERQESGVGDKVERGQEKIVDKPEGNHFNFPAADPWTSRSR